MFQNLKNAVIAAIVAGVIIAPVFGLQILRRGMETYLQPEWNYIIGGMAFIFVIQFLRPLFKRKHARTESRWRIPPVSDTARQRIILVLVLFALVWPFFTGRAQVDIATLVLIYVMLGLGLN